MNQLKAQEDKVTAIIDMFIDLGENAFSYNEAISLINHTLERNVISKEKAEYLTGKVNQRDEQQTKDNEDKIETVIDVMETSEDLFTPDDAIEFVKHSIERGAISHKSGEDLLKTIDSRGTDSRLKQLRSELSESSLDQLNQK